MGSGPRAPSGSGGHVSDDGPRARDAELGSEPLAVYHGDPDTSPSESVLQVEKVRTAGWYRKVRDYGSSSSEAIGESTRAAVVSTATRQDWLSASSGNLAQGLTQAQLEKRLTDHGALYWWTVDVLARNRKR
eukprot:1709106-Rhodomonas_salina.2